MSRNIFVFDHQFKVDTYPQFIAKYKASKTPWICSLDDKIKDEVNEKLVDPALSFIYKCYSKIKIGKEIDYDESMQLKRLARFYPCCYYMIAYLSYIQNIYLDSKEYTDDLQNAYFNGIKEATYPLSIISLKNDEIQKALSYLVSERRNGHLWVLAEMTYLLQMKDESLAILRNPCCQSDEKSTYLLAKILEEKATKTNTSYDEAIYIYKMGLQKKYKSCYFRLFHGYVIKNDNIHKALLNYSRYDKEFADNMEENQKKFLENNESFKQYINSMITKLKCDSYLNSCGRLNDVSMIIKRDLDITSKDKHLIQFLEDSK